jgi:hypothetical protein
MPTTNSLPSPALITGTAAYTPSTALLRLLLDNRLINQAAFLYFDLRQRQPTTPATTQTLLASNYNFALSPGAILSILCQLWEPGLIRNFAAAYRIQWRLQPTASGKSETELKELYAQKLINLKLYLYEAIAITYPFGVAHTFDYEAFATRWKVKLSEVSFWARDMERRQYLTLTLTNSTATVTWHTPAPVKGLNRAELLKLLELKLISKKGFAFMAFKAVRPTSGTLNADSLEKDWAIAPEKVFEYAAEYQSRDIATIYIENISIDWLELAPYWTRDILTKRKGMLRQHGYLWYAMRSENPAGDRIQQVRVSSLSANWDIHTQDVIRYLRRLNNLGVVRADLNQVTVTWYW